MLLRSQFALLVLMAIAAGATAQEPVFGLLPHESDISSGVIPAVDPLEAAITERSQTEQASFVGVHSGPHAGPAGGYSGPHHDYAQPDYFGGCSSCGDCYSCDPCCGSDCLIDYCPPTLWRFRSSIVYMDRETTDDTDLVFENIAFAAGMVTNADTLINASDFDLEWETGFDISIMHGDGFGGEYELRVLWLNEQDDTARRTGTGVELNNLILFAGFQPLITLDTFGATNVTAHYESEFRTAELNYREPFTPWWTMSIGFRYVDLNEVLNIRTADSAMPSQRSTTIYFTDNDMYGFQLGSDMVISNHPSGWEWRATAKMGIYYNRVDMHVQSFGDGYVNGTGRRVKGETGWLGEFGLQGRYNFNCNSSFQMGYQLVSIDGVALATEQMTTVLNPLMGPNIAMDNNRGTVLYHGLNLGVEIRF